MLINVRISEIFSSTRNSIPLAIMTGSLFFINVNEALPKNDITLSSNKLILEQYYENKILLSNVTNNTNIVTSNLPFYNNNTLNCVTSGN